jgi:hypothetical protein
VRDNRYGRNGFAPAFDGGKQLAAAVGGTLPNAMWDGVTSYTVVGGAAVTGAGGVVVSDTPLLTLGLITQGTPVSAAKPQVAAPVTSGGSQEPAAVVLPSAQLLRAAG